MSTPLTYVLPLLCMFMLCKPFIPVVHGNSNMSKNDSFMSKVHATYGKLNYLQLMKVDSLVQKVDVEMHLMA